MNRPEYSRMGEDFARLAASFGVRLPAAVVADVRVLARCMDSVDRAVDSTEDGAERRRVAAAIVRSLRCGGPLDGGASAELRAAAAALRGALERRGVVAAFCRLAEEILENTEAMRASASRRDYVARTAREGRLAASMALLLAGDACAPAFATFLLALSEPANLVDKLVDARADASRGEIALRPGARLHVRLAFEILRRVPPLLRLHPHPAWLLAWGARTTVALALPALRETRASAPRSASGTAGTSCALPVSTR